jgi:hypothetical protein
MTSLRLAFGGIAPALRGGAMAMLSAALLCAAGCAEEIPTRQIARREFMPFQREVYPVLLRDCGFPDCHGAPERIFRVWGPGRARLPRETHIPEALDLPTGDEVASTYSLSLSMIDAADPAHSLLLKKPLAVEAGGAGHLGVDKYGRNVYRTAQDAGYLVLARWVMSAPPPPRAGATP